MAKRVSKLAVINKNAGKNKPGRIVLHSRDGSTFGQKKYLYATIQQTDTTPPTVVAINANIKFKVLDDKVLHRLSIDFLQANVADIPHQRDLRGVAGILTDSLLGVTLTDSTPTVNVSSALGVGMTTATINTTPAHGFADQSAVTISGVPVNDYNNTWTISVTGANSFTFSTPNNISADSPNPGGTAFLAGLSASAVVILSAAGTATTTAANVVTLTPHGFANGTLVLISGFTVHPEYNTPNGPVAITVPATVVPQGVNPLNTFSYTTPPAITGPDNTGNGLAAPANNVPVQQDIPVEFIDDDQAP